MLVLALLVEFLIETAQLQAQHSCERAQVGDCWVCLSGSMDWVVEDSISFRVSYIESCLYGDGALRAWMFAVLKLHFENKLLLIGMYIFTKTCYQ